MKFSTKLRKYITDNKLKNSEFAKESGISGAMVYKYLYQGSVPSFRIAKQIAIVTNGDITMEDMGYEF